MDFGGSVSGAFQGVFKDFFENSTYCFCGDFFAYAVSRGRFNDVRPCCRGGFIVCPEA